MFLGVSKAHRFKVFRKTTKFKKFNRGLIDFVRRKNIKRKKSFNYISFSYISSSWSKSYLQLRSLSRFYQAFNTNNYTFSSLNSDLVVKLALKNNFNLGLNTFSFPTKRALNLLNSSSNNSLTSFDRTYTINTMSTLNSFDFNYRNTSKIGLSNMKESNTSYYASKSVSHLKLVTSFTQATIAPAISVASTLRSIIMILVLFSQV